MHKIHRKDVRRRRRLVQNEAKQYNVSGHQIAWGGVLQMI